MANKQLNHYRRILGRERIAKFDLVSGMIIDFYYTGSNIHNTKPLILILGIDNTNNLIHCINLNYLYEADVQNLFDAISKKVNIKVSNLSKETKTNIITTAAHIDFTKKIDGYALYENVIKPVLFTKNTTKNCYRTYKLSKIQNLNLINYRIDAVEAQVRKDANISNYALKSAELFKALIEQEHEVETDNLRTKAQNMLRKGERNDD
jgi:hypothetical protein